ncbi:SRPBCC domain-containing protein [Phyllobacterium phragmitis]|uniref:SRPBCC domain-containing protein n=1 Tax=Phyllobacterium phragmitis TaxID=2670329 RepID=UPI0018ED2AC9|nr:SRPBCC domain-containing protein [Phyllobacterium phragmitis]
MVRAPVLDDRTTFIEMSDEGGRTRYIVCALHWTEEARKKHEEMGFHEGWGRTAVQLEALARTL